MQNSQKWKPPNYILTDEWINKMWSIHAVEYYAALKRKEILTHATKWINPEDVVLSEIS